MLHISYPMLFQLKSEENDNVTYGGVLEFIAEEGRVYLPQWIIETLDVGPGSLLEISSCDLPLGKFVKFEPQSVDFLDISDPEQCWRDHSRTSRPSQSETCSSSATTTRHME